MVSQLGVYPNTPYTGTTTVAPAASSRYTNTSYLNTPLPSDDFTSSDPLNLESPTPSATPSATPSDIPIPPPTPSPTPPPVATPPVTPTASFQNAVVQPTPTVNAGYPAPVYYSASRRVYGSNIPAPTPYHSQPAPRQATPRTFVPTSYTDDAPQEPPVKKPVYHSSQANHQEDEPEVIPPPPKKKIPQPKQPVEKPIGKTSVKPVIVADAHEQDNPVNPFSLVPSHVTSSILSPATLQALGNPFIGGVPGGSYVQQPNNHSGGKHKGGDNWTQDLFGGILNNYFDGDQPSMDGITQVAGLQFTSGY